MVDTVIVEAESSPVSVVMASALAATEGGAARDGRSILLTLFWR